MRLVTRKIHRAFAELDRFDDAQCEQYLRRVSNDWCYRLLSIVAVVAVFVVLGTLCLRAIAVIEWEIGMMGLAARRVPILSPLELLLAVLCTLLPAVAALLVRDLILRLFLRRDIGRARCPTCGYSLLGRQVEHGRVRCSECGRHSTLEALGLGGPDELIPPQAARD